jgi:hypothetical protein
MPQPAGRNRSAARSGRGLRVDELGRLRCAVDCWLGRIHWDRMGRSDAVADSSAAEPACPHPLLPPISLLLILLLRILSRSPQGIRRRHVPNVDMTFARRPNLAAPSAARCLGRSRWPPISIVMPQHGCTHPPIRAIIIAPRSAPRSALIRSLCRRSRSRITWGVCETTKKGKGRSRRSDGRVSPRRALPRFMLDGPFYYKPAKREVKESREQVERSLPLSAPPDSSRLFALKVGPHRSSLGRRMLTLCR